MGIHDDKPGIGFEDLERAESAAANVAEGGEGGLLNIEELTLVNGVVLRFKDISPLVMRRAASQIPEPPVPTFENPTTGRTEENPAHPDYERALDARNVTLYETMLATVMLLGTTIHFVPEDVWGVDSDDWVDALETAGIDVPRESPARRKLSWLKLYALSTGRDVALSTAIALHYSGLSEAEVTQSMSSFRRVSGRGSDPSEPAPGGRSGDGDQLHGSDAGDGP